jgi:hypothetical protein
MTNPMDTNLNSENNSMNSLSFYWTAFFKNDNPSPICQFDGKIEHKYKEVIDNFDNLSYLTLHHKEQNIQFTIDLIKGTVSYGNTFFSFSEESTQKFNIRPIYFRRVRKYLDEHLKEIDTDIHYYFGLQYNDEKNNNHKIILEIDKLGRFILGDN